MMKTLNKIIFLLTMLITFSAGTAAADNTLYVEQINIEPGTTKTIRFSLKNSTTLYGFQAQVELPDNLEFVKNAQGKPIVSLDAARTNGENYQLVTNLKGKVLHIGAFSTSNPQSAINGNDGTIFTLEVRATIKYNPGNLKLSDLRGVDANNQDVRLTTGNTFVGTLPISVKLPIEGTTQYSEYLEEPDKTVTIMPTFVPTSPTDKSLTWAVDDESVASYELIWDPDLGTQKAIVKSKKRGNATITATTSNGKKGEFFVTVGQPAKWITLEPQSIELQVGRGGKQLNAEVGPPDAQNLRVYWVSDDDEIATVDQTGYVTANSIGNTTIRAIAVGGENLEKTCEVKVIPTPVTEVIVDPATAELMVNHTVQLTEKVLPEDATYQDVAWASSDETIATVDEYGLVTAISIGVATITATCEHDNVEGRSIITVIPIPAESITLDKDKATLKAGETTVIIATVLPEEASENTVTWTSSDPTKATVDENGKVTAVAVGEAIITATCGNVSATCAITVIPTPVESVSLNMTTAEMKVGEELQLKETVLPETATDKSVTWTSSDESVATVDENGKVTAVGLGEVTITVKSNENQSATATCFITVVPTAVEGISLDRDKAEVKVEESITLIATVTPENATDKTVTWKSSDESKATVDANGKVTGKAIGVVTITASCGGYSATCIVTVLPKDIPVGGISLDRNTAELTVEETTTLIATVTPEDATNKDITWASSVETIATVDANGKVTAIAPGVTTITASCGGYSAACIVTVIPKTIPVVGISLDRETEEMNVGNTTTLIATVTPEDATDKTITWTSSDENIATVNAVGTVKAIAPGKVTITASCGGASASCVVTVIQKVIAAASISLDKTEVELKVEESITLNATVLPSDASDQTVTWSSSNPEIATVDQNGNVVAIAEGEATITASCGELSATCHVKVVPNTDLPIIVTSITLNVNSLEMKVGDTDTLIATVSPDNAENKTLTWASGDESIVSVDNAGNIVALAVGTASITAACGDVYASCFVNVIPIPAESIDLNPTEVELQIGENIQLSATVLPENTSDNTIVWTSTDNSIATVDASGTVTAIAVGVTTINAICGNATASCKVTVIAPPAYSIELNPTSGELKVGESLSVGYTIYPAATADMTVKWSSNHPEIASVDENGNVTGNALGEAIITAICGNASAECHITVIPTPVTGIRLTNSTLLMRVGKTSELGAIIAPADATDKSVSWTSDNENIATVDANGVVTAIAIGNAIITATSNSNPSVKANCYVTVEDESMIVAVSSISISDKTLGMVEGDTYTLSATITPTDATDPSLTWRSSDTTIATVDANGTVTAIKAGEATIYVSSSNGLTEQCEVTVTPLIVDPTGISLSNTQLLMREGYTADLIAIVRPDNAYDKTVVWTTSDPEIATVDSNGIVTAIKQGVCIITAATINGHTATCEVTVVPVIVAVEEITLNKYELNMAINETFTLIATITPTDATDQTVTWKSLDPNIAEVSEYGVVTAISAGSTIIYASSSNGLTAECVVTVRPGEIAVESITLSQYELLMREGFTTELFAIVKPDEATDKTVFWSTSDPEIATVDANGVVTAIKQGVATITASSANEKTAICIVTVVPYAIMVEDITLSDSEIEIDVDETYLLIATITPEDATDKTVTWKSLDRTIATVSENGLVTGISTGVTTIYASSSNGKTVACQVTVRPQDIDPTGISITNTELLMIVGETANLIAIVHPDNATDKSVTWSSSDESIAIVDSNGNVTALRQGETIITATTSNGIIAICLVKVTIIGVESITLNKTSLELIVGDTESLIATILPENATDKTVTWISSNSEVATVSENGLVTAISVGTATIYASASNGLTAICEVTVNPGIVPVISVDITNTELLMREGYSTELIAIVSPDNATDKTVTWSSDNEEVATVNADGVVTAKATVSANSVGYATITARSNFDPTKYDQCIVKVKKEEDITAVESITLNKTAITLTEGDIEDLIAIITPDDATDKTVTWRSSDSEIAIVSENGEVTAIKAGTAIIYASSSNGLTAECVVTVIPAYVEVTGIYLTNTELLIREGHIADLIAIVEPYNATDKTVTWASSDETIASVDQNGIVTALLQGNTTITATTHNDLVATCFVTVVPDVTQVEGISVDPTTLEMEVEDTFKLTATVTPEDASDKTVTWRSSDKAIAIVDEDGTVTAIGAGTATIYASSSNGLTAECAVTVNPAFEEVISISLTNTELLMIEGDSTDLIAIVRPDNATDKSVTWTSSDEDIVTVDQNGNVDAIKQGNAIVTATASNGVYAECYVTVLPRIIAVESISISDSEIDLIVGDEYTLTAEITPEDAIDKTITWKSSNPAIATVSENGLVTGVSVGTVSVYASSSNGLTAECIVNVHPGIIEAESITLTNTELLMREGYTADLIAIVGPENATDKSVTWASTDEEIATVDQNGIVTAIHQGQTIVSATTHNGLQALCYVTVVPVVTAVEDLIISRTTLTLIEGDDYQLEAYVTPDDATDKTITWKSTDKEVAIVSENGLVSAIKVGTTTILASSSNGLTKECLVTVEPLIIEVSNISLNPTAITLSEGETATLTAIITPEDATDKTITWASADRQIATVRDGVVTGVKEGTTTVTVTSANGLTATCFVTVYARPLTPKQLLRKGDGTTCTFVVMMDLSDAELADLGYRFVYGYNDANGQSHVIEETPLRYAHTSSEIYNDPSNDFWAFSLLENKDGVLLNSNLRHLDGSEEVCFDAAKYGYPTMGDLVDVEEISSEEWISITPEALYIAPNGYQDMRVAIYTMTGLQVFAKSYKGQNLEGDAVEFRRFTPDTYIIVARCGSKVISKKIVIR